MQLLVLTRSASPLVLISGAPSIDQTLEQTGFSAHHFISGRDTVRSVFEPVTVATAELDNPDLAVSR